jgi:hypothetical protein
MGNGFEVWNSQRTWFWFVADSRRDGGTIGVAPTEAEAVSEACSSIEDMSAQYRAVARVPGASREGATFVMDWKSSLANLDRYLIGAGGANA